MAALYGSPGSLSGLMLRSGQCVFAAISIGISLRAMHYNPYSCFRFMAFTIGLQLVWSSALVCVDAYALVKELNVQYHLPLLVMGDWGIAFLAFAGACSSASVYAVTKEVGLCETYPCLVLQLSIIFAFFNWVLIAASSLVVFWVIASL